METRPSHKRKRSSPFHDEPQSSSKAKAVKATPKATPDTNRATGTAVRPSLIVKLKIGKKAKLQPRKPPATIQSTDEEAPHFWFPPHTPGSILQEAAEKARPDDDLAEVEALASIHEAKAAQIDAAEIKSFLEAEACKTAELAARKSHVTDEATARAKMRGLFAAAEKRAANPRVRGRGQKFQKAHGSEKQPAVSSVPNGGTGKGREADDLAAFNIADYDYKSVRDKDVASLPTGDFVAPRDTSWDPPLFERGGAASSLVDDAQFAAAHDTGRFVPDFMAPSSGYPALSFHSMPFPSTQPATSPVFPKGMTTLQRLGKPAPAVPHNWGSHLADVRRDARLRAREAKAHDKEKEREEEARARKVALRPLPSQPEAVEKPAKAERLMATQQSWLGLALGLSVEEVRGCMVEY